LPANHKVSVAWQIVFTFLPIVNLWAFYRIRRLTKYFLYVILPSIVFTIAISVGLFSWTLGGGFIGSLDWQGNGYDLTLEPDSKSLNPGTYDVVPMQNNETVTFGRNVTNSGYLRPLPIDIENISYVVSLALQAFSIYLVIIWSRQHNK
jgi:hypothetical protein